MLDHSRPLDLHVALAVHENADPELRIARKAAAGRRDNWSRDSVPVEAQLDVIHPEGNARICPAQEQRDRARDIAHQLAVVEYRQRAGKGSADVCRLGALGTNEKR